MRSLLLLAVVFALVASEFASAFRCFTCDGLCNCRNPSTDECPSNTHCYVVKGMGNGKILKKGCANSCRDVNSFDGMCSTCIGNMCNSEQSLTPMGEYDECRDEGRLGQRVDQPGAFGQGVNNGGLGGGAQAVGGGGLGQGVNRDEGMGQAFVGNPNNGGLGQSVGQGQQSGGLGQGVNEQRGGGGYNGLGQGASNGGLGQGYNNQYQPAPSVGMGQGVNTGGMGQGVNNNGMGQGYNEPWGQGYNFSPRLALNTLLGAATAALLGLNRY
ncbi:hypothetical protein M3Y99_01140100 [Aphelenchoides fujianensis]|nr:hypothetical protein M3Y99_01140100 [Aphelenchoides fujianensis]